MKTPVLFLLENPNRAYTIKLRLFNVFKGKKNK